MPDLHRVEYFPPLGMRLGKSLGRLSFCLDLVCEVFHYDSFSIRLKDSKAFLYSWA